MRRPRRCHAAMPNIMLDRILDTTLREGEQTPTVYFSPDEKCVIAEMLYKAIGRKALLEVGQPYSPKYREGVEAVVKHFRENGFSDAKLLGHCRTVKEDVDVARECGTWGVTVYMAASPDHLLYKLNDISYEAALKRISDVIRYAKDDVGFEFVEYTLEDATSLPASKIIEVGQVARDAGADVLKIPDTKGQADFDEFRALVSTLVQKLQVPLDLHCHNDRGLAVANSIAGLKGGATSVNTTVLGLGERCGIADLATLVENLESLYHVETGVDRRRLPELYAFVSAASGIPPSPNAPVMGPFARVHKAGPHQKAVLRSPATYETIDWSLYGLEREYEFGAMQSKELLASVQNEALRDAAVEAVRRLSMEKGRPLRQPEVHRILEQITGSKAAITAKPNSSTGAVVFLKVKPSCDELNLVKAIRKEFMRHSIPVRIRDITGDWDFLVDAWGVASPEQLNEITDHIRRENRDILETSTSIVFDEYR
ncbi:MAG: hypothetical protein QW587_00165 [Candidatus Bathyarchaeia archaeon]